MTVSRYATSSSSTNCCRSSVFLTPRWILSHLFAATLIISFIAAGFWQINRLGQRQDQNALAASRMNTAVLLDDVVDAEIESLEFRRIQVEGRFDPDSEILIANRSSDGAAGFWIWTNFVTANGDLLVNRGFVNRGIILETQGALPRTDAAVTDAPVIIEGLLRTGFDSARVSSDQSQLTRPDPVRAAELLGIDPVLDASFYLSLTGQEPARSGDIPAMVPLPDLGEGPHRSYAFQWFTFATIGVVGYLLLLRKIARGDQSQGDVAVPASVVS